MKPQYKLRNNGPRGVILNIPKEFLKLNDLRAGDKVTLTILESGELLVSSKGGENEKV